jgi:hypothetical protein
MVGATNEDFGKLLSVFRPKDLTAYCEPLGWYRALSKIAGVALTVQQHWYG